MSWIKAIFGGLKTLVFGWIGLKLYGAGKDKVAREVAENTLEDINEAAEIHNRVDGDPEYRDSVLDKFTEQ